MWNNRPLLLRTLFHCVNFMFSGRDVDHLDFDIQKDMLRCKGSSDAASSSHSASPLLSGKCLLPPVIDHLISCWKEVIR